ncbi:hypothetical protein [Streptomyces griseorubiginosus]|uniref:hypothetical protein n=1 Tax=Streptomyces griseorubiginosus TaxID=67304 RepID=UPI0036E48958
MNATPPTKSPRADDPDSAVFSSGLGDLEPADFEIVAASFAEWIGPRRRVARARVRQRICPCVGISRAW